MKRLRIGILYHGNESDVWGSMIITHYLERALKRFEHDVWRISVTEHNDYPNILNKRTDLLICEGVPEWQVPKGVWENADKRLFWWESELFYNIDTIANSNFDAVVTHDYVSPKNSFEEVLYNNYDEGYFKYLDVAEIGAIWGARIKANAFFNMLNQKPFSVLYANYFLLI